MEEFKAKSHAVKKMTRKGLVETDSREGIVKETAEAKSDGRRINEADFQLERKGAQSRADPVDDKPVSDGSMQNFRKQKEQQHISNIGKLPMRAEEKLRKIQKFIMWIQKTLQVFLKVFEG